MLTLRQISGTRDALRGRELDAATLNRPVRAPASTAHGRAQRPVRARPSRSPALRRLRAGAAGTACLASGRHAPQLRAGPDHTTPLVNSHIPCDSGINGPSANGSAPASCAGGLSEGSQRMPPMRIRPNLSPSSSSTACRHARRAARGGRARPESPRAKARRHRRA